MKYPEYDSPLALITSDIQTQIANQFDEMCIQAVQRVGIYVDKEKLLDALKQDSERYRKAYTNGYDTGYETRDDEIVRCKDCACLSDDGKLCKWWKMAPLSDDWFCADGERKSADEILMEKMDADPLG